MSIPTPVPRDWASVTDGAYKDTRREFPAMSDTTVLATRLAEADLTCAECGTDVEQGYLAVEDAEPVISSAVCATCGWGELGHAGCAPEARDFDRGSAMIRFTRQGDSYDVSRTDG